MTAPVSTTIPSPPEGDRGHALLAVVASLLAPDHDPATIIARAVAQVASAFNAAAFFLPAADSSGATSPVGDFATESLRADWRAAYPEPEAAFARAREATPPPSTSLGGGTPRAVGSPGDWPWSSVALRGQAGQHGSLLVARPAPAFAAAELALLGQVAWPLAAALDRAAQAAMAERHDRALSLLMMVDRLFSRRLDDVDLLFATLSDLVELIGTTFGDSCALFVAERGQATLLLIDLFRADPVERERQRATLHTTPTRLGEGLIGEVALGGTGRLIARNNGGQLDPADGVDSWLCVPLRYDGRSLGALTVGRDRRGDPLTEGDLRLCETIGRRVAAALTATELAQLAATARDLLADSPDPAFTLSIGGQLLAANAALCGLLGYSAAQIRERHIGDLLAPEGRDATLEFLASVIVGGAPLPAREWALARANGERRIIEVRVKVLSELGQPIEIHCAGRDLTARHEDQRALARQGTELATLHITGLTLADALEPDEIRRALLGAIRAALPCDDVTIYSLGNATMQPELSLQPGAVPPPAFPHGHPLIDGSVLHGQSVLLNDAPSDPEFLPLGSSDPLHLLIVPLLAGGQARGSVVLRRMTGEPFTLNDLRLVESIATPAALTLQNARLHAETSGATTDLRAVLESIQQGILMTNRAGHVRFANRRFGELFGVDVRAIIGWHDLDVAERLLVQQARDPKGLLARLTWLNEHIAESSTDEVALSRATGRILERYSGPMRNPDSGAIVGRIIVYTDVTAGRQLERAKDEFLATASHELKTPITTLGGYLELLERQIARPDGPDRLRLSRYVSTARRELARLRRLSEDLLEVARIEAGRLTLRLESADLAQTVRETVEHFIRRPGLDERGHRILCDAAEPLPAPHDPLRIGQVVANLLENALKYSPAGGDVLVTATHVGEQALLRVRDSGIGVPESEREQLFLPFYRTTNASEGSPEGLGLGLYISRGIVEGHGGTILVEPAEGGGTVFTVTLPLAHTEVGAGN